MKLRPPMYNAARAGGGGGFLNAGRGKAVAMDHDSVALDRLQRSIKRLYSVFASHPRPARLATDGIVIDEDHPSGMLSKPLRSLSPESLQEYAWKAMTTQGTDDEFRYFLPRLFELRVFDPEWDVPWEICFGKLAYGNWWAWPQEEQEAIRDFTRALWEYELTTYDEEAARIAACPIYDVFCGLARCIDDLRPYLEHWRSNTSLTSLKNLADLVDRVYPSLFRDTLGNCFCEGRETEMKQIRHWLLEEQTRAVLEAAFFEDPDGPNAARFSEASKLLGWAASRSFKPWVMEDGDEGPAEARGEPG
jgi:hypothetical protein